MSEALLASVIVSSYNYERFLRNAIESALGQTYPETEVIVVDDASTDDSPKIIAGYGDRIIPVLRKRNEGGRATYNQACRLSRGEVIFILDSDDVLSPTAVERAIQLFHDRSVVNVHRPLWEIDAGGRRTGRVVGHAYAAEDLRERVLRDGPSVCESIPTSGHAWSRHFLQRALPIPPGVRGDAYTALLACLMGEVRGIPEPEGGYRVHSRNEYASMVLDERLRRDLRHDELCYQALSGYCRDQGLLADVETWKRSSWNHVLYLATEEIQGIIPPQASFILVDGETWGTGGAVAGRRALPFLEHEGDYWGLPPDDQTAIRELERLRRAGAEFMVFAWPAFWWLDYYSGLHCLLRSEFSCLLKNDRLVVFDLRSGPQPRL